MATINSVTFREPPKFVMSKTRPRRPICIRESQPITLGLGDWKDYPLWSSLVKIRAPSKKALRRRRQKKKTGGRRHRERFWAGGRLNTPRYKQKYRVVRVREKE